MRKTPTLDDVETYAEPPEDGVAVHPTSPSVHDPDALDGTGVAYITAAAADRLGLPVCIHCSPSGRRTVIQGPGGGGHA